MDESAIKAIGELAIRAAEKNIVAAEIDGDQSFIIMPDGSTRSLEQFAAGRSRFRGSFATPYLSEFVWYVKAHEGGEGFIDAKACSATVFFNLGDKDKPGHADWRGTLQLEPTAAYAAVGQIDGKPVDQRALVEWVEDWAANLTAPIEGQVAEGDIGTALAAIRNLTITQTIDSTHNDRDLGATRSKLEDIEAKSKAAKIPPYLTFRAVPFEGFASRDFRLRLSVLTGDKPRLLLRIVAKQAIEEEIAKEFKAALIREVGDSAKLTIGSFKP